MVTVYLIAAGVGCTLIVVQFILQLIGIGGGEMEASDAGGPPDLPAEAGAEFAGEVATGAEGHGVEPVAGTNLFLGLLSFRTISAFLAFFGLVGLACEKAAYGPSTALALSTLAGLASMVLVALAFRFLIGLQASGTVSIHNAVGKTATVYLPIPGERQGRGKVILMVQGRIQEYAALTGGAPLPRGSSVRVTSVVDASTVEVEAAEKVKKEG